MSEIEFKKAMQTKEGAAPNSFFSEYHLLLQQLDVAYIHHNYYLSVGGIPVGAQWLLELSVIEAELDRFISVLAPLLVAEKVVFALPVDRWVASNIINSRMGYHQTGKVVIIFPASEASAVQLAVMLIDVTKEFRCPDIPTDSWLGGGVYTRYGTLGIGIEDQIPFQMPVEIKWPFSSINKPLDNLGKKKLKNQYQIIEVLSNNAKGDSYKARYSKGLFNKGECFVKQGRRNVAVDDVGRDAQDRLQWQFQVHKALEGIKGIPRVIDLFTEGHATYLVMELVKGKALSNELNVLGAGMLDGRVPANSKIAWLNWLLQISKLVKELHARGYVHRDITPENFLITQNGVYLIDLELSCSLNEKLPAPPFRFGTRGYMSPQQIQGDVPSVQDDIYGLGALIFVFFTSISPVNLDIYDSVANQTAVCYLTGNTEIGNLVVACMDPEAELRPNIADIIAVLKGYSEQLSLGEKSICITPSDIVGRLDAVLHNCLAAYGQEGICNPDGIWWSKPVAGTMSKGISVNYIRILSPSFREGISGILFLLAAVKSAGLLSGEIEEAYQKNLLFIKEKYLQAPIAIRGGLYEGGAGVAVAIAAGIEAGLIADINTFKYYLNELLLKQPFQGLDMAKGVAGKGMAILLCWQYLDRDLRDGAIIDCIDIIREHPDYVNGTIRSTGFSNGLAGVVYFMWCCAEAFKDSKVLMTAKEGMEWLDKRVCENENDLAWFTSADAKSLSLWYSEGAAGVLLCYLKAWQVSGIADYRNKIIKALGSLPSLTRSSLFIYEAGLSGLGDVYLEAWKVLGDKVYLEKATDILSVLLSTVSFRGGWYGWKDLAGEGVNGGLLTGNGGGIYFLMRFMMKGTVGPLFGQWWKT